MAEQSAAASAPTEDEAVNLSEPAAKSEGEIGHANPIQLDPKPHRKRNKPSLSCETCTVSRKRKAVMRINAHINASIR